MDRAPGTGYLQRGMMLVRNAVNFAFLLMCLALGYGYYSEELARLGRIVLALLERLVTS